MATLIITNGDSAADLLAAAGRDGEILPWRDVLHEGRIRAGTLEENSAERAAFLAGQFDLPVEEVAATFAERDAVMRRHAAFDRIELWFEHDLYDQLQLVQILSFLADEDRSAGVVLVQADDFLGHQRPQTILRFAERARAIGEAELEIGDLVWADLAMPTPDYVVRRLGQPLNRLPFVAPALLRFLEELPGPNGLSRTEEAALAAIAAGTAALGRLFGAVLAKEQAAFMGDASFFAMLGALAFAEIPLIAGYTPVTGVDDPRETLALPTLELTEAGRAVLAGEADHVALNGLDRWWAGTRLKGRDVWRYERASTTLLPPSTGLQLHG